MNKSEIGIEELRERLAKFVGWEVPEERPITLYGVEIGKQLIQKNDGPFQPDIDRNQTALLLEKVAIHPDREYIQTEIAKLALGNRYDSKNPVYGERLLSVNSDWLWQIITCPPETICRAILEVMSQEPTQ